jgi:hypothetical protein
MQATLRLPALHPEILPAFFRRSVDHQLNKSSAAHLVSPAVGSAPTCRYRSITKQFFRKADGVVVMYDITSELTFTGVRQWLTSVQVRPVLIAATNSCTMEGNAKVSVSIRRKKVLS